METVIAVGWLRVALMGVAMHRIVHGKGGLESVRSCDIERKEILVGGLSGWRSEAVLPLRGKFAELLAACRDIRMGCG